MDVESFIYGLIFILTGLIVIVYLYQNGDFDKGSKLGYGDVKLLGGAIIGILGGLYFLIKAF